MTKINKNTCIFCGKGEVINNGDGGEIWWLNPNTPYGKTTRNNYYNVQIDVSDYSGNCISTNFKFNYCPICGKRLK